MGPDTSFDVYVKIGEDRAGEDEFGEAVAHFRQEHNALEYARRLEARGETVRVARSTLYDASETMKESWYADYDRGDY